MYSVNYSENNILNLVDPQRYICNVWSFRVNHRILLVRMDKDKFHNETLYLSFTGVLYFAGPVSWVGANFYIGETDECIKLLRNRGFKDISQNELLDNFGLFVVELPNSETVKILAYSQIEKNNNIPPDFPWLTEPITNSY